MSGDELGPGVANQGLVRCLPGPRPRTAWAKRPRGARDGGPQSAAPRGCAPVTEDHSSAMPRHSPQPPHPGLGPATLQATDDKGLREDATQDLRLSDDISPSLTPPPGVRVFYPRSPSRQCCRWTWLVVMGSKHLVEARP